MFLTSNILHELYNVASEEHAVQSTSLPERSQFNSVLISDVCGFTGAGVPHLLEVVDPLAPLVHLVKVSRFELGEASRGL